MKISDSHISMFTSNQLRLKEFEAGISMERIASGLRINRGADDPSGLAISAGMQGQIRGLDVCQGNVQDGASMFETMDATLSSVQEILLRLRELAVRAANEAPLTSNDRRKLDSEAEELTGEIDRLAATSQFNGRKLFNTKYRLTYKIPGDLNIHIMNSDGTGTKVLVTDTVSLRPPLEGGDMWSPDGTKIIYFKRPSGSKCEIFCADADGSNKTNLTNSPTSDDYPLGYSPDGSKILFQSSRDGYSQLYMMNSDGSNPVNLSNIPKHESSTHPRWSPDGSKVLFSTSRFADAGQQDIVTVDVNTLQITRLTNTPGSDGAGEWSPDGSKIVFGSYRVNNRPDIFVMNADGSNPTRLTYTLDYESYPIWSPDGSKILFNRHIGDNYEIFIMNADGSDQKQLTFHPEKELKHIWSPDSSQIVFHRGQYGPGDIFVMDADGSNMKNLTDSPGPAEQIIGWAPPENEVNYWLQVGPDNTVDNGLQISVYAMNSHTLGVGLVSLASASGARTAISNIDGAIEKVSDMRTKIGAKQEILSHIADENRNWAINISAANSRIEDADMAKEITDLTKEQLMTRSMNTISAEAAKTLSTAAIELIAANTR